VWEQVRYKEQTLFLTTTKRKASNLFLDIFLLLFGGVAFFGNGVYNM